MSVGRKVFHCVVDDSALTVNISEIKKWTSQGAITLIVPLYSRCLAENLQLGYLGLVATDNR